MAQFGISNLGSELDVVELLLMLYFPRASGFCVKIKVKSFIVEKMNNMPLSKEDTANISMLAMIFFCNATAIFEIKNKYMIKLTE